MTSTPERVNRKYGAPQGQTVFYPVYKASDAARGLNPLSDQNLAGGVMMVEQIVLTTLLLGRLFYRFAAQDEERQRLLDLADKHGVELTDERAARAVAAGAAERLRQRIASTTPDSQPRAEHQEGAGAQQKNPGEPAVRS